MGVKKAVVLRYEEGLPAPFVSAKGQGRQAERIQALAREAELPLVAEPAVAEGLYPLAVGEFIPTEYFLIIAQILAEIRLIEEKRRG